MVCFSDNRTPAPQQQLLSRVTCGVRFGTVIGTLVACVHTQSVSGQPSPRLTWMVRAASCGLSKRGANGSVMPKPERTSFNSPRASTSGAAIDTKRTVMSYSSV